MASWYSNLLTKTSSQISSLRSTLLASEADGDTDDDTHVCRVLRNYYTDKGRPFPPWLPADPKAPPPTPGGSTNVQPLYANGPNARMAAAAGASAPQGNAALSSLWGDSNAAAASQSLRATPRMASVVDTVRPGLNSSPNSYTGPVPPRETTPTGGASAQDRLRQRFRGGARTTSPGQAGQTPFQPPPPQQQQVPASLQQPQPPSSSRQGLPSGPRAYR
ncbi:TBC1 domain family member 15 [Geosmithia morbida]|uniref:TBC1 domain family member 15 n=1 Tax=Geosmithia morbida TaxID=1094350 RepID=A0A9P4YS44_9HYPO|nr:TBC1 domain family member 15 [Geosmithia morbida]KAF4120774.1 TBC1 domain family member 15 [Geosmithia morbida]